METVFVARQPIFDRALNVYAYELLFRGHNLHNSGPAPDEQATSHVLVSAAMDIGLDALLGNQRAFVNLGNGFLDGTYPFPLTPDRIGIEVLEDVVPTPAVIEKLREFRQRGYIISLDDFCYRPELEPLLELAHIVKLDIQACNVGEELPRLRRWPVKLLAEKVETFEEFRACVELGFDYFQGFFLAQPQLAHATSAKTQRAVVMNLIARLQDPEAEVEELEALIVQDVALTYRLLRHVNSAAFMRRREIESVREAIIFLGTHTIRDWACLILLTRMDRKPRELATTALIRAKMCESLASAQQIRAPHAYFTTGLFSLLDAFMDQPLPELLDTLPLTHAIKSALLEHAGPMGKTLQQVLWYEQTAWDKLDDGTLEPGAFTRSYMEAVRWAHQSAQLLHDRAHA